MGRTIDTLLGKSFTAKFTKSFSKFLLPISLLPNSLVTSAIVFSFLIAGATNSTAAYADVGDFSASLKGGKTVVSDIDGVTVEEESSAGFNFGYQFLDNWSAEIEYVTGGVVLSANVRSIDVEIVSAAAYATYRSDSGNLYFTTRIGVVQLELKSNSAVPDATETGLSYGAGGGYQVLPNLGLELDYTIVEADTDWLMLSARFTF